MGRAACKGAGRRRSRKANAPPPRGFVCGLPGCPSPCFPFPLETRGWSAGRRQGAALRLPCTSRRRGLQGRTSRSASAPTADTLLPGAAACGVRAASNVGRCASRGSTAMPLSGTAPCSVTGRPSEMTPSIEHGCGQDKCAGIGGRKYFLRTLCVVPAVSGDLYRIVVMGPGTARRRHA